MQACIFAGNSAGRYQAGCQRLLGCNQLGLVCRFRQMLIWLCLCCLSLPAQARDRDAQLALMAAELLPVMLNAIETAPFISATSGPDAMSAKQSNISLGLVFRSKKTLALSIARNLQQTFREHTYQVNITVSKSKVALATQFDSQWPDIVFFVDPLKRDLGPLLALLKRQKILTYSPRIGDLHQGAALGISVTEKVLPAVNPVALSELGLSFSSLFMRIAQEVP